MLKLLNESIINVFDENGNKIDFQSKEIKLFKAKYSSNKKESVCLFLNDIPICNNKKHKRRVEYKCKCGNIHNILLCKFLEKKELVCPKCKEIGEKAEWQKLYFKLKRMGIKRPNKSPKKTVLNFSLENDEFKERYFQRNLTLDEFERIKKYIYSIDGILVENKDYDFIVARPTNNQHKYSQSVIIEGEIHTLKNIYLRCPLCGEIFHITRKLKERVLNNNFDCKACYLSNKTFKVRKFAENLTYQGNEELNFINKCLKNDIKIVNGPKIEYDFDNKKHKYFIDFLLPDLNLLIEIKDEHIWHKKQVESGKWEIKLKNAQEYAKNHHLKYKLLFPKDINDFFNLLKR